LTLNIPSAAQYRHTAVEAGLLAIVHCEARFSTGLFVRQVGLLRALAMGREPALCARPALSTARSQRVSVAAAQNVFGHRTRNLGK
jgi:hypothetical protein